MNWNPLRTLDPKRIPEGVRVVLYSPVTGDLYLESEFKAGLRALQQRYKGEMYYCLLTVPKKKAQKELLTAEDIFPGS